MNKQKPLKVRDNNPNISFWKHDQDPKQVKLHKYEKKKRQKE